MIRLEFHKSIKFRADPDVVAFIIMIIRKYKQYGIVGKIKHFMPDHWFDQKRFGRVVQLDSRLVAAIVQQEFAIALKADGGLMKLAMRVEAAADAWAGFEHVIDAANLKGQDLVGFNWYQQAPMIPPHGERQFLYECH